MSREETTQLIGDLMLLTVSKMFCLDNTHICMINPCKDDLVALSYHQTEDPINRLLMEKMFIEGKRDT